MDNRRKFDRIPTNIALSIESLYKQDHVMIDDINENIVVTDVSKSGIGFASTHQMPIGYYFNAKITFDDEKFFYSVLKIIRIHEEDNEYDYGCEFVGLADILALTIDDYASEVEDEEN